VLPRHLRGTRRPRIFMNTEGDWMFLPVALKLSNGSLTDLFDNLNLAHILCLGASLIQPSGSS
jgi:hypothetical protein